MLLRILPLWGFLLGMAMFWPPQLQAQQYLREKFSQQVHSSNWNAAIGIEFDDQNRMWVWEKSGKIYYMDNGTRQLFFDLSEEVINEGDNGLLGFVRHPDFYQNGYFYLFYPVDRHHLDNFGTPNYDPNTTLRGKATVGRLTRYQADPSTNFTTVLPNSRTVFFGQERLLGPPIMGSSHGPAGLVFGSDGTLLVGMGDGSPWETYYNGEGPPYAGYEAEGMSGGFYTEEHNLGSFRSQMLDSYSGKILRLDPLTGEGVPSNPFFDEDAPNSVPSKVWTLGIRNPFRMTIRPETGSTDPADARPGSLYIGDVSGAYWEEINVQRVGGKNFGWPVFDGYEEIPGWKEITRQHPYAPNPLYGIVPGCETENFTFNDLVRPDHRDGASFPNPCDSSQQISSDLPIFEHERPAVMMIHRWRGGKQTEKAVLTPSYDDEGNPQNLRISDPNSTAWGEQEFWGNAIVGGDFYTGSAFPEAFHGSLIMGEYLWGWVNAFKFDLNDSLEYVIPISQDTFFISDLAVNPIDGCIYHIQYPNKIIKTCYDVNVPPVPVITVDEQYGTDPLTVQFDASESYDPTQDPITYHWDFADGTTSTEMSPSHTFTSSSSDPRAFEVILSVTDTAGNVAKTKQIISLNNTPPEVEITSIEDGGFYPLGGVSYFPLEGTAVDAEFPESQLAYEWTTILYHNTHFHEEPIDTNRVSGTVIQPAGCEEETYYFGVKLRVSDPAGLSTTVEHFLYPDCVDPFVEIDYEIEIEDGVPVSKWRSIWEDDCETYYLERSPNGQFWESLGQVEATGTGSSYNFADTQPLEGYAMYRLLAENELGNRRYDQVREVMLFSNWSRIYPNPTDGELVIEYDGTTGPEVHFTLFDLAGRKLMEEHWEAGGIGRQTLDLGHLPTGVYLYRIEDGIHQTVERVRLI
ncbi:PQQ-dependent sugar dehydrogenase [Pontibacter sp. G13]|uniref:PQQ-dependent sugar dehydrogenase n=1 Tax=Pontibacter sp. G13 TaxID=3074898 RepID=UPI0028894194|nr:PQQ-dependent sugar dehydrogenase [Pontibacter sp. G13]WNJ18108.1 PQQ-dependent sugar dehydrogenase [Pontibacter sp. G13]